MIGATSVTREVTAIGDVLDLRIVVVDPRPPFATSARLGEGARVIAGRPDGVLVVAAVAVAAFKYIRDDASQAVISVCIPFLAYLPAYRFGFSGVLATVTAGVLHAHRSRTQLAPTAFRILGGRHLLGQCVRIRRSRYRLPPYYRRSPSKRSDAASMSSAAQARSINTVQRRLTRVLDLQSIEAQILEDTASSEPDD